MIRCWHQTRGIEQVVTNLVVNALKFTPPGGSITVSVCVRGPHALLEVKDTGVGIATDILPTIFRKGSALALRSCDA